MTSAGTTGLEAKENKHANAFKGGVGPLSFRFLHTADWHLGMKATGLADAADQIRSARLETARRIMELAHDERVDFVLIAGDVFDDNSVGNKLVYQVLHILEQVAPLPVFILPGNHDLSGPASVYQRLPFHRPPANVHVLTSDDARFILDGEVVLLPAPVTQKRSERDPTRHLPDAPGDVIRIGVAHGSPAIEGKYEPDDHPIRTEAAEACRLDYLALGHWHTWQQLGDRTVMPGTPESTAFNQDSGYVAIVDISKNSVPQIKQVSTGTLTWLKWPETIMGAAGQTLSRIRSKAGQIAEPGKTLLQIELSGYTYPEELVQVLDLEEWLGARFLLGRVDKSGLRTDISTGVVRDLAAAHSLLGAVLADLSELAMMAAPGESPLNEVTAAVDSDRETSPLSSAKLRQFFADVDLDPGAVEEAVQMLTGIALEVWQ